MTPDRDLPGLADELETVGGATMDEADIIIRAVSALRASASAASAPDGVVAWRWRVKGATNWVYDPDQDWLDRHRDDPDVDVEPLYAAPQSFTSGHIAGQREMQEALEHLKQGIRDIARACVEGRICDDVAWFTEIPAETLFDKCCNLLGEDLPTAPTADSPKSDGGVEGHATPQMTSATPTRYPETEGEEHMGATARRTEALDASTKTGPAGIKPGPSEPSSQDAVRQAFEAAWAKRPWISDESDKDRAFRWWCAALTAGEKAGAVASGNVFIDPRPETNIPELPSNTTCNLNIRTAAEIEAERKSSPTTSLDRLAREALEKACRDILPYLRWTIGPESPGHHPTMPSAVAAFSAALQALGGSHE